MNDPPPNSMNFMISLKEYELYKSFINTSSSSSDDSSYTKDASKQNERHHSRIEKYCKKWYDFKESKLLKKKKHSWIKWFSDY